MNITNHTSRFIAIGVLGAALLTGGGIAEATDEFPSNPSVVISFECKPIVGGDLHVTYKNDGGLSDAEFTTVIDGVTKPHVSLDAAIWGEVHYPLPEGSPGVVTISAPNMSTVNTTVGPVDCFDDPTTTTVVETTIPETTMVETTVPETTAPDTSPTTVPATTPSPGPPTSAAVIVDAPTTSTAVVGLPQPVQLPETGSSTTIMLLTAIGLIATGWLLRRSTSA